jgi:serine/threonine-protein kinase
MPEKQQSRQTSSTRKLAAIMFTDIVGYTSLMGESERKAFETINTNREIHQRLIAQYHGKIVKELGDGLLAIFDNGTEAVQCAIQIQWEVSENNIPLRIGIHEGEILMENNDVFGDGVNIASRIQAEAAIGGVCISEAVYRIIKNKEDIKTGSLGKKTLKNVEDPILLFQLKSKGLATRSLKTKRRWVWILAIAAFLSGIAIGVLLNSGLLIQPETDSINHFTINLSEKEASTNRSYNSLAISPDGSVLVYTGKKNNTTILYKRYLDSFEIIEISGTEEAYCPFFSPDGKWIGFYANNQLHKTTINGGKIYNLGSLSELRYATWLPNDSIVLGGISGEGLKIMSALGGIPENLTNIDFNKQEWYHNEPTPIPGTDKLLYTVQAVSEDISINSLNYRTGEEKVIIKNARNPKYIPTGHIMYEYEGSLYVNAYDAQNDIISESSFLIIESKASELERGIQYDLSNDGIFIYYNIPQERFGELVWIDMKGNINPVIRGLDSYIGPKISPDGKYIAFWRSHLNNDQVWIYDIDRESMFNLTTEGQNFWPIWDPDGKSLYFPSLGQGRTNLNIYMKSFDKAEPSKQLIGGNVTIQPKAWSSDGEHLLYHQREESERGFGIYLYNKSSKKTEPFLDDNCNEGKPDFSPDNKWVVYESDKSGYYEVYVTDFPDKTKNYQISVMGGYEPLWSYKGNRIFYRKDDSFYIVNVELMAEITFGKPKKLFTGNFLHIPRWGRYYDLSPDENHFVAVADSKVNSSTSSINVITNFFEQIKQKTAEKK